ncbi:MAG: hypothetical protein H7144_17685 [Burkholderiales bacterium]|nr:hypothetical protein [Phycisphaerae bacterium]
MRGAGIGLIGLLLAGGIIFYMMWGGSGNPGYVRPALEAKRDAEVMTNAVSGRDEKGAAVTESITYEMSNKGAVVKTVVAGGAMDKKYGLKPGDVITEIGPLGVDQFGGSQGSAGEFMQASYARPESWTVLRGGQKIRLPEERDTPVSNTAASNTPAPTAATQEPAAPGVAPVQRMNPKKQALDVVKQIEQH